MKKIFTLLTLIFLSVFFIIVLSGCASTESSRFYTLSHVDAWNIEAPGPVIGSETAIGIGSVMIPDYLDRPNIITRTDRNELQISEFNKWAGALTKDIQRVLAANISAFLSTEHVYIYPWKKSVNIDILVAVNFIQFDGVPGGNITLEAQWTIFGDNGDTELLKRTSAINEKANGKSYRALVEAKSRALAGLSRKISDAILSISQKNTGQ